jgi:endonuclease/exonuclease/phosphatase family metal-dependent hydrolase
MHSIKLLLCGLLLAAHAYPADLRVMTFNVRYPAKSDGANVWENRRDLLVDTIRTSKPDIVGTQELFHFQGQYIADKLPEYKWFGVSRRGNQEDEHMGVFYRADRLKLIESGNYWLSETPETPGSMSWNVTLPRMVTWGIFEDSSSGKRFHFFNTHFAHRQEDGEARENSARVIAGRLAKLPAGTTAILTGDFNTDSATEPYKVLTAVLTDAWSSVQKPAGPTGTFHGFSGKPRTSRIDWILYRGSLKPRSVETITHNDNGRYPSDHFPVLAVFEWE